MSDTLTLRNEIVGLLASISDEGTGIDTGGGLESEDIWVTVGGIEFYIQIQRSNAQKRRDAEPPK